MKKTILEKTADKLVNAFVNNKIIAPLPIKSTKTLSEAQKLRKLCESKVKDPIIGFKAAGTGIPVMKKLKEKKPFYAAIFKKNFIKSGKKVKINIGNLKTNIANKKIGQSVNGNTNTVYINPLNSLRFVLNELKKDKVTLDKDFYVFTGSTVGVVPILGKGLYTGKVDQLGSAKAIIH